MINFSDFVKPSPEPYVKFRNMSGEVMHCSHTMQPLKMNLDKFQYECSENCPGCDGKYKCEPYQEFIF